MKIIAPFLAALLAAGANAATVVLYETGWEAAPAAPSWALGNVAPQNGWEASGNIIGNTVVANGAPQASIGDQAVVTPHGSQFHRFTASTSTTGSGVRSAWVDFTADFVGRPAAHDLLIASIDVFIPSTQATDASRYGIIGYNEFGAAFGAFVRPSIRGVVLLATNLFLVEAPNVVPLDTWVNLSMSANFQNGAISISVDGTPIPALTGTVLDLPGSTLTDIDLGVQNSPTAPVPRSIFTDNYRVVLEELAVPRPTLALERPSEEHLLLSWDATFANWILESTEDITAAVWDTESATPLVLEGQALVILSADGPRRFYKLRAP